MKQFSLNQTFVENRTHLDLVMRWVTQDGKLVLIIEERENRSAAGIIIPKNGEKPLS